MTGLSAKQRKHLKGLAHSLNPVAFMGQKGITPAFLAEVERGLKDHELIKVKIACEDQEEMQAAVAGILAQSRAEWVQSIGHILILYRQGPKHKIALPA